MPVSQQAGTVLLPDAVLEKLDVMQAPGSPLTTGTVYAAGKRRGRIPMPEVGATVGIKPHAAGLTVEHNDLDLPETGKYVPEGFTMRIVWVEDVLAEVAA